MSGRAPRYLPKQCRIVSLAMGAWTCVACGAVENGGVAELVLRARLHVLDDPHMDKQADRDDGLSANGLTSEDREELRRLRRENS